MHPAIKTGPNASRPQCRSAQQHAAIFFAFAFLLSCKKEPSDAQPAPHATNVAVADASQPSPSPDPTTAPPSKPTELSQNPAERPASRMPPSGKACADDGTTCPSCDDISQSIDEVPARLAFLGIPAATYALGETDAGSLGYEGIVLVIDSKNESLIRLALEGKFERFFDATASVRKKHKLTNEQARAEFDNLRLGLMGHIWCDGQVPVHGSPTRSSVARRVAFAFANRPVSFKRVAKLDDRYGWYWPPGFKPLGYTALGAHEQLLEKVYESGNSLTGGVGYGYVTLRKSQDEMLELRDRVGNVIADFVFVPDLTCNGVDGDGHPFPCSVDGLEFPTMVVRDPKTKKAFLIQHGLKADE